MVFSGAEATLDEGANRIDGTHNTRRGTSGSAVQFSRGVDIRTPIKVLFPIGLRAEVRDLYTAKPNYNVSTGGGFKLSERQWIHRFNRNRPWLYPDRAFR